MSGLVRFLFVSFLFVWTTFLGLSAPATAQSVDLVQIDTGNSVERTGILKMATNCYRCWHPHGTEMASALENELQSLKAYQVRGEQIIWREQKDIPAAVLQAAYLKPKVIAMSLSGEEFDFLEYKAIKEATSKGILVVVAAGNEGQSQSGYPGRYGIPCLVSVSTVETYGKKVSWANSGDVYLPQASLREQGTSFSAARMAGIAIKYFQDNPRASCAEAEHFIRRKFSPARLGLKLL